MAQAQAYSPTDATPYQAYQPPEPPPAPPPTQLTQQQPYQFTGAPTTHLGAAAGLLDNIFRGYMRGKEEGQAKRVMQMKAKSDNLRNSYDQDARLWLQMKASGVDPNSPEFKQATSAAQGSWDAMQEWIGQHVNPQDDGTKKKKGKKTDPPSDPLTDLRSQDPAVKAKALYQLQQKMGPPVMWQVKNLSTPEAQAARKAQQTNAQAAELGAGNNLTREQTEKQRNDILAIPEDKRTDAQKQQLKSAEDILTPPAKATTEYEQTRAMIARKVAEDPSYVMTDSEKAVLAGGKPTYPKPPGSSNLKEGSFGAALQTKYGDHPSFDEYLKARREWATSSHFSGGGAGASEDKAYNKWHGYYKEHYPAMGEDEWDTLARRKIEGSGQMIAGQIGSDAATEPQKFDSDVIASAIDNLRKMPQYSGQSPLAQNLDQALSNLVGLGDSGYQYHDHSWFQQSEHQASDGKYAGDVDESQLKALDRDLQTQVRVILSKQTGIPQDQKRAAQQRMAPLFGPAAAQGSGTSPASPPAAAAATAAPASSPAPSGNALPPAARAHLKAGTVTTFGNGQQWTLDEHGQPKQVK